MVFTIHEMDGLILEKIKPLKVRFNLSALVSLGEYERVLRCKPQLKKDQCTLEFESLLWDVPIIAANYDLQRHLLELVRRKENTTREALMCDRISSYLMANAYLGIATLEEIASNFNVSPRTLQRKLREEGTSFKELSDSVRKSIALNYVKTGDHPVREISCMLGYNELSAFTRAFRRWTGITPVDYRKKKTYVD